MKKEGGSADDFLSCIRESEADLTSLDPESNRRLWRKAGAHLIRIHQDSEDLRESLDSIKSSVDKFHEAVFDPYEGIIVRQQKYLDRFRWTIVVLGGIATVVTFTLGVLMTLAKFWH